MNIFNYQFQYTKFYSHQKVEMQFSLWKMRGLSLLYKLLENMVSIYFQKGCMSSHGLHIVFLLACMTVEKSQARSLVKNLQVSKDICMSKIRKYMNRIVQLIPREGLSKIKLFLKIEKLLINNQLVYCKQIKM